MGGKEGPWSRPVFLTGSLVPSTSILWSLVSAKIFLGTSENLANGPGPMFNGPGSHSEPHLWKKNWLVGTE